MRKITALFVGIAALAAISTTATVAEAKDRCGRGMFYNGQLCVPKDGSGIGRGPDFSLDFRRSDGALDRDFIWDRGPGWRRDYYDWRRDRLDLD